MSDIDDCHLISLQELRDRIYRDTGRTISRATVYNWINRGVGGRKLGIVRMGGRIYTTNIFIDKWLLCSSPGEDTPKLAQSALLAERKAGEVFG